MKPKKEPNYNYSKPFVLLFNTNKFNKNTSNQQTDDKYQDSLQFLNKFKDRIEKMGREGIIGIVNHTSLNVSNSSSNLQNKNRKLPPISNKRFKSNYSSPNLILLPTEKNKREQLMHNPTRGNMEIEEWRKYPNVIPNNSIQSQYVNIDSIENHNIYQDRGYIPYSLKDYKNVMQKYKNNKMGGLGANLGTRDWKKRALKFKKMNEYGGEIVAIRKGIHSYLKVSPDEEKANNMKMKEKESIRYKTRKYGKGVMLNRVREEKRREKSVKELQNLLIEEGEDKEVFNDVITISRENYINRLAKLKESLIQGI